MQYGKLAAAFGAAFLFCGLSVAIAQQMPPQTSPNPYPPSQAEVGRHQGYDNGGWLRVLTPEQRALWKTDHRAEMKSLTPDQRHAYKHQLKEQFLAMTPAQQARERDRLQAEWNGLPPAARQRIEQHIAMREQRRLERRSSSGAQAQPSYSHPLASPPSNPL